MTRLYNRLHRQWLPLQNAKENLYSLWKDWLKSSWYIFEPWLPHRQSSNVVPAFLPCPTFGLWNSLYFRALPLRFWVELSGNKSPPAGGARLLGSQPAACYCYFTGVGWRLPACKGLSLHPDDLSRPSFFFLKKIKRHLHIQKRSFLIETHINKF